jgi:hypothetical protein
MLAAGVAEGDVSAATDWLAGEAANLSEADVDERDGTRMSVKPDLL